MVSFHPVRHDPFAGSVEVYVIRHGSTALNATGGAKDRIRGWSNVPLSQKGRQEVQQTAVKLQKSGLQVLVHSDLDRARDTAQAIVRATGAKLIPTSMMRPWNLGHFTGKESNAIHQELQKYVVDMPDKPVPGGESFNDFKTRVFTGVGQAIDLANGKKLGLVTHHRVERLLTAWASKGEPQDLSIEPAVMLKHGEDPAAFKKMMIRRDRLPAANGPVTAMPVDHNPYSGQREDQREQAGANA